MKINISQGSVSPGDIYEHHLVSNHLINPSKNADKIIMYAEKRYLMTLLTSGVRDSRYTASGYTPSGGDSISTKIKQIPQGEMLDANAWQYSIMGRIQRASVIISQVGNSTAGSNASGGTFQLKLNDNLLGMGMVVRFANNKQARINAVPTGSPGNYIYSFQCFAGETFAWASWVAIQAGTKTCFGGYSSYGERSRRGYSNFFYPDKYIQHTTTQRKSLSISGHANANKVLWYELNGEKGMVFEAEAQARAQFLLEDEDKSWWGESTMRDQFGNLLAFPSQTDEKGDAVFAGDGYVKQISGSNDMTTSGLGGKATYDDMIDMMRALRPKKNSMNAKQLTVVTGSDGYLDAFEMISAKYPNIQITQAAGSNTAIGGQDIAVGYKMNKINFGGDQILFVENPLQDDSQRFPKRLSNGKLAMSSTYYFMDLDTLDNGRSNIEIRARGREGVDRNLVYFWQNGMSGMGKADNPVDAIEFHMLKETALAVYDTGGNGILSPDYTA